ncbi:hypothetical protein T484DRAFT_2023103, partial [Baffinella frigidus]
MPAADDPSILIDLLQSLISETRWVHAELWLPSQARLFIQAMYTAPGHTETFDDITNLTRSLALAPGSCLAGTAFQEEGGQWDVDIQESGALLTSPRASLLRRAGVCSALSLPVAGADGSIIAVVVLLSLASVPEDGRQLAATLALCDGAAPYLEHIALPPPPPPAARRGMGMSVSVGGRVTPGVGEGEQEEHKGGRTPMRYNPPSRPTGLPTGLGTTGGMPASATGAASGAGRAGATATAASGPGRGGAPGKTIQDLHAEKNMPLELLVKLRGALNRVEAE